MIFPSASGSFYKLSEVFFSHLFLLPANHHLLSALHISFFRELQANLDLSEAHSKDFSEDLQGNDFSFEPEETDMLVNLAHHLDELFRKMKKSNVETHFSMPLVIRRPFCAPVLA